MTTFVTYTNYGNMAFHEVIMTSWPWVSEEDARRIAEEAERLKSPVGPEDHKLTSERAYRMARYARGEALLLRV